MAQPTKRELAGAVARLSSLAQQLHACYANDTQPNRAEAMAALAKQADKEAEILWRLPCGYGQEEG